MQIMNSNHITFVTEKRRLEKNSPGQCPRHATFPARRRTPAISDDTGPSSFRPCTRAAAAASAAEGNCSSHRPPYGPHSEDCTMASTVGTGVFVFFLRGDARRGAGLVGGAQEVNSRIHLWQFAKEKPLGLVDPTPDAPPVAFPGFPLRPWWERTPDSPGPESPARSHQPLHTRRRILCGLRAA